MLRLMRLFWFRSRRDENSRFRGHRRRDAESSDTLHCTTRISRKRGSDPAGRRSAQIVPQKRSTDWSMLAPRTPKMLGLAHSAFRASICSRSVQTCLTRFSNTPVRSCSQTNASSVISKCLEYRAFT